MPRAIRKSLDWGLRMVLLVGMPAALGLALLAEPLTATLFRYGKFTAYDTRMVGLSVDRDERRHSGLHAEQGAAAGVLRAPGHAHADARGDDHRGRRTSC